MTDLPTLRYAPHAPAAGDDGAGAVAAGAGGATEPPPSPAFRFFVQFHRTGRALGATLGRMLERGYDLELRDYLALSMLRRGVRFPSELADGLELPRDTASRIVAKLLDRGLIDRAIDPDDSRRTLLRVTDLGQATRTAIKADIERTIAPLLDDLGEDTRECLTGALERFSQRLLEGTEDPSPTARAAR